MIRRQCSTAAALLKEYHALLPIAGKAQEAEAARRAYYAHRCPLGSLCTVRRFEPGDKITWKWTNSPRVFSGTVVGIIPAKQNANPDWFSDLGRPLHSREKTLLFPRYPSATARYVVVTERDGIRSVPLYMLDDCLISCVRRNSELTPSLQGAMDKTATSEPVAPSPGRRVWNRGDVSTAADHLEIPRVYTDKLLKLMEFVETVSRRIGVA